MTHSPIFIKNITLSLPHKVCFEDFSTHISYGSRIAIIGQNGCGKSTLLNILSKKCDPTSGRINMPEDVQMRHVPQIITEFDDKSGGERVHAAITHALLHSPNLLLLDEPTNHLDEKNRKNLHAMLAAHQGTLILISHDRELLRHGVDSLWHMEGGGIHTFSGSYDDYICERKNAQSKIERELLLLSKQKREVHDALMKEQFRASKSKEKGAKNIKQRKWPTVVSTAKATRAEETSGKKKSALEAHKQDLTEALFHLRPPEIIVPKFDIPFSNMKDRVVVSIQDGAVAYVNGQSILENINISLNFGQRLWIRGSNGSGKSTLIKGIFNDISVMKTGVWNLPNPEKMGYMDQHYTNLPFKKTVVEYIHNLVPSWTHGEVRRHLNDFLFRKNTEVNTKIMDLSGGEKARLSLSSIAARPPKLLILDEVTNNLDLETKDHVIKVLQTYPGTMILISHDADFVQKMKYMDVYDVEHNRKRT